MFIRAHRFLIRTAALAAAVSCGTATAGEERVVVADFEDVGSWRVADVSGVMPGVWFSGGIWMSGTREVSRNGDCAGEIRFDFDPMAEGARRMVMRRAKMSRVSGFLDGIEFDADSGGHAVSLGFILVDSRNRRHVTPAARLGGAGWAHYRVDLGQAAWPGAGRVNYPARLEAIVLTAERGGGGSVFMDDLALTGSFTRKDRVAISPLYSGINYTPGVPFVLGYRVRNAGDILPGVEFSLRLLNREGREMHEGRTSLGLPARDGAIVTFDIPALPAGAYEAVLTAKAGDGLEASYDDPVEVFVPNGGRVNRSKMWFGVQDTTIWNGAPENRLHLEWLKELGVDLVRIEVTGSRFEPGEPRSLEAWSGMLRPLEQAGIDVLVLYNQLPGQMARGKDPKGVPGDLAVFEGYAAKLGGFLEGFGNVRYVEFWNEPDIGFYHGTLDEYLAMMGAFSRGMRSAAPSIKITTGGSTVKHPREKPGFSEALYSTHGDLYDVAAFHAHGPLAAYAERQRMVEAWQARGGLEKPVANTESGDRSGYEARGRLEQAMTLVRKMAYAKSRPRSEFQIWFTLQDFWDMDPEADDSFGLVTSDNRAKPALAAYNELIRQLANTTPEAGPELVPGVDGYAFLRGDGRHVLVCWASEGGEGGSLWLQSAGTVHRVDMFGLVSPLDLRAGGAVPVGREPFYLVFDAPVRGLGEDERSLLAPSEVYHDPRSPAVFRAVLRNVSGARSGHVLSVRDASGKVVWKEARVLESGEVATIPVSLTIASSDGPGTSKFELELARDGGGVPVILPLVVQGAYVISGSSEVLSLHDIRDVHELTYDPSIPAWRGADDLSVEARVDREPGALVWRFTVVDDRQVQNNPDGRLWRGDSVQVAFFNPANGALTHFDLGLRGDEAVVWCHKNADPALLGRWTIPATIRREGTRTLYEARVPYAYLGLPDDPEDGTPVRFSFLVNEDDGQGRVRWMRWKGGLGDSDAVERLGHGMLMRLFSLNHPKTP